MKWTELTIRSTEEAVEMIANRLHELGAGGVSIEETGSLNRKRDTSLGQWYEFDLNDIPEGEAVIKAYFNENEDVAALEADLRPFLAMLQDEIGIDIGQGTLEARIVDDEDWADAWKQYFKPLRVSERLTVKPTWEEYEAGPGELVIEMDPGMAFGTGTHATTALCLRTLERVVKPGDHVIDVGTGSGILAVAAAKLGAERVLAVDLDPVAVSSAKENSRLNGMSDRIVVLESDLLQVLRRSEAGETASELGVKLPVQVVVANILAEIILLFIGDVYEALQPGGRYIVSGVITAKAEQVENGLRERGFVIESREEDSDWVVIVARKPEAP
ncbi:50S ribosomal protein L11 methyltransferase [Paenibacillus thermoaerophilus]|uniref:Ribosomal protein L11 methyltransferase n=1 Tax=Paenibacillus thermoaerophilus TaxID=1215385 RepID=A0ABW2UXF9_9BACL|nr:50S ribosomal protein L11 methyltransferase [Paenibacillus thermoaerophilus]TMV19000.1 50S ribosomal protein L11 methyltransferase [Paenibacillus thermoaerophilus]